MGTAKLPVSSWNPVDLPRKRRSNIAHEVARLLLKHEFECVLLGGGQGGCRKPAIDHLERDAVPK